MLIWVLLICVTRCILKPYSHFYWQYNVSYKKRFSLQFPQKALQRKTKLNESNCCHFQFFFIFKQQRHHKWDSLENNFHLCEACVLIFTMGRISHFKRYIVKNTPTNGIIWITNCMIAKWIFKIFKIKKNSFNVHFYASLAYQTIQFS